MSFLIKHNKIIPASNAELSSFHGNAVFTTLRSRNGIPVHWREHWLRVSKHAQFFGYPIPDENEILKTLEPHLYQGDRKLRVIIGPQEWTLTVEDFSPPSPEIYGGVAVHLSSWQAHAKLGAYKTANSLPYVMAQKEAVAHHAFEALLTNQDEFVVDGARTSLIHFDGKEFIALAGGLAGIMREVVLDDLSKDFKISTRFMRFQELTGQLLLANSLMGVVPVAPLQFSLVADIVERYRQDLHTR